MTARAIKCILDCLQAFRLTRVDDAGLYLDTASIKSLID